MHNSIHCHYRQNLLQSLSYFYFKWKFGALLGKMVNLFGGNISVFEK